MIQFNIITKLGDIFERNEIVKSDEKELFTYGLQQGLIMILNIVSSIVIGILFGMVWESILFMVAYIPLRSYAGGYHARTQTRCYILSIGIMGAVLWGIKFIDWTNFNCLVLALIGGLIIFIFAPRGDENKPLDELEKVVYKSRARRILLVEELLILVFMFLGWNRVAFCIVMALMALSFMLIIDYAKSKLKIICK